MITKCFFINVAVINLALVLGACDRAADNTVVSKVVDSVSQSDDAPANGSAPTVDLADSEQSAIVAVSTHQPDPDSRWQAARFATAGKIAEHPQRPGDVTEGRRALLEEPYVSCGLPERVFRQLLPNTDVVTVSGRTAKADGLPFSTTVFDNADGLSVVSNNCLSCHGTPLFGELVIGLGNEFLDFTGDASALVERAGALVQGDAEIHAWELFADRINAIAPFIKLRTVGVNPANNLTFALIAHRDAQTNAWSETPLLPLPPTDAPPVSVPPWWRMAKKTAMFNLGEGRLDHARIMMSASMLCSDTLEELEEIDAYAPDIRAFIESLEPPAYPFSIDPELSETGRTVFNNTCSHCHGAYDGSAPYPSRLVPIDLVQTDSLLVDFAHDQGLPYIDWFNRSYYGDLSQAAPGPGYVAPPLDGIWATAPFLHNGSVPTIAMVLDSSQRPDVWRHDVSDASDPGSYDQARLGWAFTALPEDQDNARDKRVYDTNLPGYSNSGHLFGDHLSEGQRLAVIEYLKTL